MANYKVVDADKLDADLQTVADAIKSKAGTEETMEFPSGFASAVENMPTADHTIEDGLITGTLTEYTNDRVEKVRDHALYEQRTIASVYFPRATTIGNNALRQMAELKSVNFPVVTTIGDYAFSSCSKLDSAYFPLVRELGEYVFQGCSSLKSVCFPSLTSIGRNAFQSYGGLTTMTSESFPIVSSIGDYACRSCNNLSTVNLPNVRAISTGAFYSCNNLTEVYLDNITFIPSSLCYSCAALIRASFRSLDTSGTWFISNCPSLREVDLGLLGSKVTNISSSFFSGDSSLKTVVLRANNGVCVMNNLNAFDSTPFASGGTGGTVYVPRALIESYQKATNWSTLYAAGTCTFLALEDYTVDGTTTGEIDWDKINGTNLISFTIDGTSYKAEEGMTWAEWVASDYNTGGFGDSGVSISASNGYEVGHSINDSIKSTDVIEAGANYITYTLGSN